MAQTRSLVAALKQVLKGRGLTYADVARGLGMSEASVKRVFPGARSHWSGSTGCADCSGSR